jgi:transposase
MRGRRQTQATMLAFVDLEERVPRNHPLRVIKQFADRALAELSPVFDEMYSAGGRPSIPPERLLKASLLISLHSVRSERAFCEELDYQLLFRWFLDMALMEPSFDPTVFTKNRRRLLKHEVAQRFFDEVVRQAAGLGLLSDEHFTVDGTLIEAAASLKSFRPKDKPPSDTPPDDPGNPTVNFHGERRSNATHQSTTDPEARLAKKGKGKEAHLAYTGHALMENRHGLLVDFQLTQATGTAERDAVPELIEQARERGFHPRTLAGDKGYDTKDCVADLRQRKVAPHVTQNTSGRRSAIDRRTTRHVGYAVSQRIRKRVEEIFGWMKTVGGFRRTRYRGLERTQLAGYLVATGYKLVRLVRLVSPATAACAPANCRAASAATTAPTRQSAHPSDCPRLHALRSRSGQQSHSSAAC